MNYIHGTRHPDRSLAALKKGYVRVANLTLPRAMAMSVEYGALLNFYDVDNVHQGYWSDLFLDDESFLLALILATDLEASEQQFLSILSRGDQLERKYARLWSECFDLVNAVDQWFGRFSTQKSKLSNHMAQRIAQVMYRQSIQVSWLMNFSDVLASQSKSFRSSNDANQKAALASTWQIERLSENERLKFRKIHFSSGERVSTQVLLTFKRTFFELHTAILEIKKLAESYYEQSLHSQRHDPAVGNYIAFLALYDKIQSKINQIPRALLSHYYVDHLKLSAAPIIPDSTYLTIYTPGAGKEALIESGCQFNAGKDSEGKVQIFEALKSTLINDVKVAKLMTLYQVIDTHSAPENDLNFITAIQKSALPADQWPLMPNRPLFGAGKEGVVNPHYIEASLGFALSSPVLLLNEGKRKIEVVFFYQSCHQWGQQSVQGEFEEAWLPLDLLKQIIRGESVLARSMQRYLLTNPEESVGVYEAWLEGALPIALELNAKIQILRQSFLSQVFKQNILGEQDDFISLYDAWVANGHPIPQEFSLKVERLRDTLAVDSRLYFYRYFNKIFDIHVTAESGWSRVPEYSVQLMNQTPCADHFKDEEQGAFKVTINLPETSESIVPFQSIIHSGGFDSKHPLIRFNLNEKNTIYPYSLLEDLQLSRVQISASVQGIKDIALSHDQGLLDGSKTFHPFGAMPKQRNYLVLGCYEAAQKNINALSVDIEWGDLPAGPKGFESHYEHYQERYSNDVFRCRTQVLRNGSWFPDEQDEQAHRGDRDQEYQSLFESMPDRSALTKNARVVFEETAKMKPIVPTGRKANFQYNNRSRSGFVRIQLAQPWYGFGHRQYPMLLVDSLAQKIKKKNREVTINEPYTPLIESITLNYQSSETIQLRKDLLQDQNQRGAFYHIHPFGVQRAQGKKQSQPDRNGFLLPRIEGQGSLYLGLQGNPKNKQISLFFDLAEDGELSLDGDSDLQWSFLADDEWRVVDPLNKISDTTEGFLNSGVINLLIPKDINLNYCQMPAGYYWIKVSCFKNAARFASLKSIHCNTIKVARHFNGDPSSVESIPQGSIQQARSYLPGVKSIKQWIASKPDLGLPRHDVASAPTEINAQQVTRLGERLKHKQRAITPWDYERLILEEFPELEAVKCFPNRVYNELHQSKPGRVLIAVVPKADKLEMILQKVPTVNGPLLRKIVLFVTRLMPSQVSVEVKNPLVDRIKIHCSIKLAAGISQGYAINHLNQALNQYICPWTEGNYQSYFNWKIQKSELEAFIRAQECVEYVTNFSMLKLAREGNGRYDLYDSARGAQRTSLEKPAVGHEKKVSLIPTCPWSVALPTQHHYISFIDESRVTRALPTGIDKLEIAENFIIE